MVMRKSPLLLSILSALSACSETFEDKGCMDVSADATSCPAKDKVETSDLTLPRQCGDDLEITEILGGGKVETITNDDGTVAQMCCYKVEVTDSDPNAECMVGRPYYEDGRSLAAPLLTSGLGVAAESERAAAWAKAGAAEHASVAAFARLALELLSHGAPSELLTGVHQAALDEIRHAELCFSLAKRFGSAPVRPGAFPFTGALVGPGSLAEFAAAALRDGCLGETLGAHVTEVAAALAPEPEVRQVLASIAAEESTHAVLSFRIVAWALRTGGPEVRAAVLAALDRPWPRLDVNELALRANVDVAALAKAAERGVRDVLKPAVSELVRT
jgi:hypothetical protein